MERCLREDQLLTPERIPDPVSFPNGKLRPAEPGDHPHPLTTLDHFRDNAFCSAALATIVVRHHHRYPYLGPDVDRSMAEFEECRLEWTWIFNRDIRRWGSRF